MDIKALVIRRMEDQHLTPYDLAKRLKGRVKERTLYDYLKGPGETNTKVIGHVFDALGIVVRIPIEEHGTLRKVWQREEWRERAAARAARLKPKRKPA